MPLEESILLFMSTVEDAAVFFKEGISINLAVEFSLGAKI